MNAQQNTADTSKGLGNLMKLFKKKIVTDTVTEENKTPDQLTVLSIADSEKINPIKEEFVNINLLNINKPTIDKEITENDNVSSFVVNKIIEDDFVMRKY
jgi:hypothetical protein